MANVAVFLPRQLSVTELTFTIVTLVIGLAYIFWRKGGRIQKIVLQKTGTRYVRSATIIDFVFALILVLFKEMSNTPMSTTWVFVGLLAGRELAIYKQHKEKHIKSVFPLLAKDFFKMMIGLGVSIGLVLAIQYL